MNRTSFIFILNRLSFSAEPIPPTSLLCPDQEFVSGERKKADKTVIPNLALICDDLSRTNPVFGLQRKLQYTPGVITKAAGKIEFPNAPKGYDCIPALSA